MNDLSNYAIEDFRGGIAGQRKRGPKGSFKFAKGVDIHGEDNVLSCNYKLAKDSATIVTDLVLTMIRGSDEAIYAFGNTGKIYRKPSGGAWGLAYTDTDGKITGAAEFERSDGEGAYKKYIYWATQTKLKSIEISTAGGAWAPETETFDVGNVNHYHTMRVGAGVLMICDGQNIALVDREGAFNDAALLLPSGCVAKTLLDRNDRIIIGAEDDVLDGWLFTWDRFADSWITKTSVQAQGVNAMAYLEGGVMVQVGEDGRAKFWNFGETHPLRTIPGTGWAYPGAIGEHREMLHVGMNSGTKCGVYTLGRLDKNDPLALNLEYVPSHGKITGVEIGSIAKDGTDLYVSWKDGTSYGIDKLSSSRAVAVYESLEYDAKQPESTKLTAHIKIVSKTIPTGCSVVVKYKTNRDADWVATKRSDNGESMVAGEYAIIFDIEAYGENYEVQVTLTPNGSSTPEIYSINNYFSIQEAI